MDPAHREVLELIKEYGGEERRSRKHVVYRFPDGRTFTTAATPSDNRAWLNCLSDLRRLLGVQREIREDYGVRREKKYKSQQQSSGLEGLRDLTPTNSTVASFKEKFGLAMGVLPKSSYEVREALNKAPHEYRRMRTYHAPSARHGEVKTIPIEVRNEAQYLKQLWGAEVADKFLQDYIDEHWYNKKKEGDNMANPLEDWFRTAKANAAGLQTEIEEHEQKAEHHRQQAQRMRKQVEEVNNFLAGLEMVTEQAKKSAPALQGILPSTMMRQMTRATKVTHRTKKSSRGSDVTKRVLGVCIRNFGVGQKFRVTDIFDLMNTEPDLLGVGKPSVYGLLHGVSIARNTRPALVEKVGSGMYQLLPAAAGFVAIPENEEEQLEEVSEEENEAQAS